MTVRPLSPASGGSVSGGRETAAPLTGRQQPAPRLQTAEVTVTLSPAARQHLSRLEGFTATIGTSKQPKQMAKPGLNIDIRT